MSHGNDLACGKCFEVDCKCGGWTEADRVARARDIASRPIRREETRYASNVYSYCAYDDQGRCYLNGVRCCTGDIGPERARRLFGGGR